MIPKIIHYCWFGGSPKPELTIKCIESWKKYLPNYEIKEWNETNFDVNCCDYVKEAYDAKKWAFVSDYARFYVMYEYGGIYFDTDVEVLSDLSSILNKGSYIGREFHSENEYPVNPGIGFAIEKNNIFLKEILQIYEKSHFFDENGTQSKFTIVEYTTDVLKKHGLVVCDDINQKLDCINVYSSDYFSPQNMYTGVVKKTKNTKTIHYYFGSWDTPTVQKGLEIKRESVAMFGRYVGKVVYLLKYSIYIIHNEGFVFWFKKVVGR